MRIKAALLCVFLLSGVTGLQGCSAVMAAKQPDKKNIRAIGVGSPRNQVIAEWGVPTSTETRADGTRLDIYTFKQGYSGAAKVGRTAIHGLATVATLGMWEIVGTPMEAAFDGKYMAFQVIYDKNDIATSVVRLK